MPLWFWGNVPNCGANIENTPQERKIISEDKENTTSFARDLGLFDATMIGVGAMIGAGIFVLTGIAAGEAGPASILAFALNGVVTLLTAFAYAELASAIPRAGGGYSFVRAAFPGAFGFTAGWMLWFAYTVSCSLYALGFAGYFWEFFLKYAPELTGEILGLTGHHLAAVLVTGLIALFFVTINVRGAEVTGKAENFLTVTKLIILAIFIYFGLKVVFGNPAHATAQLVPFFPKGAGGVLISMGLTFIAFEGYDLIATVAEEIKEPEKNIPRATFISLGVAIVMYLLILFVSLGAVHTDGEPTWQFLGKYKETAIIRAAEGIMPAFGVALIVLGGLLSTMSALNATILASSRVAFSMARDKLLPGSMAKIDPKSRTPRVAIIVTGILIAAMAVSLPIEIVGSAASLIFLLAFALVNLALIALRRKAPDNPIFQRLQLLTGAPALEILQNSRVVVFGLGGVGSWAAEALARSGVGDLTLVDNDVVCITNVNRQLQATTRNVGRPKATELTSRLADLNPRCKLTPIQKVYEPATADSFALDNYDYVLDCIDSISNKVDLILRTLSADVTLYSSMGAASKLDPTRIRVASIWETAGCPLARIVRRKLREANFEGDFQTVFSPEVIPPVQNANVARDTDRCYCPDFTPANGSEHKDWSAAKKIINGSAVHITATFGMFLAGLVVQNALTRTDDFPVA